MKQSCDNCNNKKRCKGPNMLHQPCLHAVKPGSFERLKEFYASECCTEYEVEKEKAIRFIEQAKLIQVHELCNTKFKIEKVKDGLYSWIVFDLNMVEIDGCSAYLGCERAIKSNLILHYELRDPE